MPDPNELRPSEPIMHCFQYEHLPVALQRVSRPWCELAKSLVDPASPTVLPRNAERSVALRKLLEGKDAAVRAAMYGPGAA
jgi:hypothetical protein